MQEDVYVGTAPSFEEAIEHHRRLPPHLRNISLTILHASNIAIFAFGMPREGVERSVRSLGLGRNRRGHELDLDILQGAIAHGSDDADVSMGGSSDIGVVDVP